jgi:protein SCO1/2
VSPLGRVALAGVVALAVTACAAPDDTTGASIRVVADPGADSFEGTLVTDPTIPRPALVLPDTTGQPYDLQADRDGVTALFFGYTQCPDVCPTTMADLAAAKRSLPPAQSDRVEVVFVTEDPERDTPQVLRSWLERFDPEFVGLVGGNDDTTRVLDTLHLPRTEQHTDPPGATPHAHPEGDVDHSGVVYLFGPDDVQTVIHTGGSTPGQYAADIEALLGA